MQIVCCSKSTINCVPHRWNVQLTLCTFKRIFWGLLSVGTKCKWNCLYMPDDIVTVASLNQACHTLFFFEKRNVQLPTALKCSEFRDAAVTINFCHRIGVTFFQNYLHVLWNEKMKYQSYKCLHKKERVFSVAIQKRLTLWKA